MVIEIVSVDYTGYVYALDGELRDCIFQYENV